MDRVDKAEQAVKVGGFSALDTLSQLLVQLTEMCSKI
jgi:hypothetical protein